MTAPEDYDCGDGMLRPHAPQAKGRDRCGYGPDCPECRGYGYFLSAGAVLLCLERSDCCGVFADDDAAAAAFVRDLEDGDPYARECARELLGYADDEPDDYPEPEDCPR